MRQTHGIEVVVIGGSMGALTVLMKLLSALPRDFEVPIVVVIHLPPATSSRLVEVLGSQCALVVKEPEDKEPLAPATVYVAPPNYHLLLEADRRASLSVDPPVHFSRPSIDVLFDSAADAYGPRALGVLLSGANEDGARGLARIADAGGITVVQAPETAEAATMPNAALARLRPREVLPASAIGAWLAELPRRASPRREVTR